MEENCHNSHNSRKSNNTDVKLGPVTKLEKKNLMMTSYQNPWRHFNSLDWWPIWRYSEVEARRIACKTYIFINSNLCLTKTLNRTKESLTQLSFILTLWVKVLFFTKNADISKIKAVLVLKVIFFETTYVFVFTYQIESLEHNSKEF